MVDLHDIQHKQIDYELQRLCLAAYSSKVESVNYIIFAGKSLQPNNASQVGANSYSARQSQHIPTVRVKA